MSRQENIAIAHMLLEAITGRRDPTEIAAPFEDSLVLEIQLNDGMSLGKCENSRRTRFADLLREIRILTEIMTFDVEDILASELRVAIVGALKMNVKKADEIATVQFAIILTIADGAIIRFQMLEYCPEIAKVADA